MRKLEEEVVAVVAPPEKTMAKQFDRARQMLNAKLGMNAAAELVSLFLSSKHPAM
jgi:hypothetical protein